MTKQKKKYLHLIVYNDEPLVIRPDASLSPEQHAVAMSEIIGKPVYNLRLINRKLVNSKNKEKSSF